jgi:hypothetical protein
VFCCYVLILLLVRCVKVAKLASYLQRLAEFMVLYKPLVANR